MATKEDILEQITEEYLIHKGYFVQHNVKFLPDPNHKDYRKKEDSNHSDIDVLGYHPRKPGVDKVVAVSCKSWQGGFKPDTWLKNIQENKKSSGRPAWKAFRELTSPKWSEAFCDVIYEMTGSRQFTYVVAVSHCKGDKALWEREVKFQEALNGNSIKVLTFGEMVDFIEEGLSTTLAATEVGRLLQMFKAANLDVKCR